MRNNYYAEVTNRHLIVKYTAEEDAYEVFESNSEQDKRREKNEPQVTSKPPEEVSLYCLELWRLKFEKANC